MLAPLAKGHEGNAWRMIVDLSFPKGRSVK